MQLPGQRILRVPRGAIMRTPCAQASSNFPGSQEMASAPSIGQERTAFSAPDGRARIRFIFAADDLVFVLVQLAVKMLQSGRVVRFKAPVLFEPHRTECIKLHVTRKLFGPFE